jgi:hypothetical protein
MLNGDKLMSIENTRAHVISSIWKAIAQSGVDLSSLSEKEQTDLVNAIADNLLVTVDSLFEEATQFTGESDHESLEEDERAIWTGRPFLSLTERYTITSERIRVSKGIIGREIENFELIRIQDLDISQKLSERLFGLGDLIIRGHDASHAELVLRNIRDPEKIYELLRRAWLDARKKYGLTFQEEM